MTRKIICFVASVLMFSCCLSHTFSYGSGKVIFSKDYGTLVNFTDSIPLPSNENSSTRQDLLALFSAYPSKCVGVELTENYDLYIVMSNGFRVVYDDRKVKSFEEKLDSPDIQDMVEQEYIAGPVNQDPAENFDPGRFRPISFFKAIYGETKQDVTKNIVKVHFIKQETTFNSVEGASDALKKVHNRLSDLIKEKPELINYVIPLGGTLNWRIIEGTQRLSPHSFGTAIDLNPAKGVYWRWGRNTNIQKLRREYPLDIINAFEENGFIWGGKWYHYDLMHFEYRPELLQKKHLGAPESPINDDTR